MSTAITKEQTLPDVEAQTDKPMLYIRLHPIDRNHAVETYIVHQLGLKFDVRDGWARIPADLARALAKLRTKASDPGSPRLFQIGTLEQAKAIDVAAKRAAAEATAPKKPTFLSNRILGKKPIPFTRAQIEELSGNEITKDDEIDQEPTLADAEAEIDDFAAALEAGEEDLVPATPAPKKHDLSTSDLKTGTNKPGGAPATPKKK